MSAPAGRPWPRLGRRTAAILGLPALALAALLWWRHEAPPSPPPVAAEPLRRETGTRPPRLAAPPQVAPMPAPAAAQPAPASTVGRAEPTTPAGDAHGATPVAAGTGTAAPHMPIPVASPVVQPAGDAGGKTPVFADEANPILRRERLARMLAADDPALPAAAIRALADPDPTVVIQGAQILERLAHRPAVPALLATLAGERQRPDGYGPPIAIAAIAALGACGDRRAVPAMTEQLARHEDLSLDNAAVQALGSIADPASRPAVAAHLARLETLRPQEAFALTPWQEAVRLATASLARIDRTP